MPLRTAASLCGLQHPSEGYRILHGLQPPNKSHNISLRAAASDCGSQHSSEGCSIPTCALTSFVGCSILLRAAASLCGLQHLFEGSSIPLRAAPSHHGLQHPFSGHSIPLWVAASLHRSQHPVEGCSVSLDAPPHTLCQGCWMRRLINSEQGTRTALLGGAVIDMWGVCGHKQPCATGHIPRVSENLPLRCIFWGEKGI